MKVKDILAKLGSCDPDLDVLCFCEDEDGEDDIRFFTVSEISASEAETRRDGDRVLVKFEKSEASRQIVFFEITGVF